MTERIGTREARLVESENEIKKLNNRLIALQLEQSKMRSMSNDSYQSSSNLKNNGIESINHSNGCVLDKQNNYGIVSLMNNRTAFNSNLTNDLVINQKVYVQIVC